MRDDYYQLLEAAPSASKQELRDAYRRMAKRYHPDHNDGDPRAEEHFKLIVEAWRTLGNDEKRLDYDAWLERHRRFATMPEMAGLARHARMTVRRERIYRRRREDRRSGSSYRARPFLLRRSTKVSGLHFVILCVIAVSGMFPFFKHQFAIINRASTPAASDAPRLAPGESPLPPDEQKKNLENYLNRVVTAAEGGDAEAQWRYGFLLYLGGGGVQQDREAARLWWEKAAAQGDKRAQHNLLRYYSQPKPETSES